jgi:chlorite dismutase/heme-degrading monooxygenase HmoA
MVRREPPHTEEGWYALHDFRTIDWAAWQDAPQRVRERAIEEAVDFLESTAAVADADDGGSALYAVLGHKADLVLLHLRPSTADLDVLERRFERTEFARFTERATSYVSVTEASGYSEQSREYFEGELDENSGLANYIQTRLHPTIPDAGHVCFYPMDKRRDPDYNWYDLPFEERAQHMDSHGDIGRDYAGKVTQMITGSIAMDDWEWGVTLWGDDVTDFKDLLYEMRFDPSTSKYAEFGPFYVGRRFPPADLGAYLAGHRVPTDGTDSDAPDAETVPTHPDEAQAVDAVTASETGQTAPDHESAHAGDGAHGQHSHADAGGHDDAAHGADAHAGEDADHDGDHSEAEADHDAAPGEGSGPAAMQRPDIDPADVEESEDIERRLAKFGVYPEDYDDGDYGLVFYSGTPAEEMVDDVEGLRANFEHYDTHVLTSVRAEEGQAAVVSVWENERAAMTASGFLSDLDDVTHSARGPLGDADADGGGDGQTDGDATATETGGHDDGDDIRGELADLDVYAGQPHGEDVYALVLYSQADIAELFDEVDELRDGFDRYDTHVRTSVYDDPDSGTAAVVSLWDTQSGADKAATFLTDLPEVVGRPEEREGFGTMGMFYTVKPDHRTDFTEKFETVGGLLGDMDGHRETALLVNHEDENDMFIASQWDSREDAMGFFRSDAFRDTVEWGRDVLADRPRHVFLA